MPSLKEAEARALRVQLQSLLKRDACLDDLAENRVGLLLLEGAERKLFRRGQARFNFQKFAIRGLSCRAGIR
jgi:hypothetical protein